MITSKEIAQICGVSRGTVDRALNGRPGINPKTKQKVLEVAKELGYQPDIIGRSLVKGSSMSIGVILFDLNNRVFPQIVNGLEAKAREHGFFVYLTITNKNPELEFESIRQHMARKADGIILLSVNQGERFDSFMEQVHVPLVTLGNRVSAKVPYVWIDDCLAMRDLVDLIAGKGYERIVYVSPPMEKWGRENVYVPEQRYAGLRQGLERHRSLTCETIFHKAYLTQLLQTDYRMKRTAIVCSSDIYAMDIASALKDRGYSIPGDVGIAGFDNIDSLKYFTPHLATVSYQAEQLGAQAMESLLKLIRGEEVHGALLLKHTLVEGESL